MTSNTVTIYDQVGGIPWFVDLIGAFYDKVETDSILRPMYPEDLTESRQHMVGFLVQFFGGPTTYSDKRGHPRLRMRHLPFTIGQKERDAWLKHMIESVQETEAPEDIKQDMILYFDRAATHMINTTP